MFDGGWRLRMAGLGTKKAILRVLFPMPARGLAGLGRGGAQGPFYARFRITFPAPGGGGT